MNQALTLVYIASSRPIGDRCRTFAQENLPEGCSLTGDMDSADVLISVLYDKLINEAYLSRPGRLSYNFHPGVLPSYRGSGAFSWAILNGEEWCGVTLHLMDVGIDSGPIIEVSPFPITHFDTAESLFNEGMEAIYDLFVKHFRSLCLGLLPVNLLPQDESKARTYYRRDLQKQLDLTRYARAFTFEGKARAYYYNRHGQKIELEY